MVYRYSEKQLSLSAGMAKALRQGVGLALFVMVSFQSYSTLVASEVPSTPPVRVVVVSGSNYDMGVQYGEQAADLIASQRDKVWNILVPSVRDNSGALLGRAGIDKDIQVWSYYIAKYDPKLQDWLRGMAQGCSNKGYTVSYADLVAIMVVPEELWCRPAGDYPAETGVVGAKTIAMSKEAMRQAKKRRDTRPISACSAFAATKSKTPDGEAMVTITGGAFLELTDYVILVAYPTDGERFITLTYAGRIANNHGMNSHYAWVMPAAIVDPGTACAPQWGLTAEAVFHYLVQYPKSPEEAVSWINSTPRAGATGQFVFADKKHNIMIYETAVCNWAVRKPGDLGETDFLVQTNNYDDPSMVPYNLNPDYNPDSYVRYNTLFEKLRAAGNRTVSLDFIKNVWLANDWFDVASKTWHTIPVPNDNTDPNMCFVPGNLCEGGEYQIIQYPKLDTVYLQLGVPQGTSIVNYWPQDPKPTGEYTKWQLSESIDKTAGRAAADAFAMVERAQLAMFKAWPRLNIQTRKSVAGLLNQASQSWWKGRQMEKAFSLQDHRKGTTLPKTRMAQWGEVYTDYATAQLYAQMASTQLNQK
ncbi:MAG: hypothetical protein H6Q00_3128 [Holophagaceae bacterium]|nr:hypothetical protein [Holophagaceae bacterium]